jgi:hypothetical protein
MRNVGKIRRLMNSHHDRHGKLWVAEVGWGTGGPHSRFNIGKKGQAKQLDKLLHKAYKARHRLKLQGLVYYGWQDRPQYSQQDMWGLHTGLRTLRGRAKPSFKIFSRVAPKLH